MDLNHHNLMLTKFKILAVAASLVLLTGCVPAFGDTLTNSWGLPSTNTNAHTNLQLPAPPGSAAIFWQNYFRTNHPVRSQANPTNP